MLLTIANAMEPATDLGFLLHKNPARVQSFEVPHGVAHVFYPEATATRCTAVLLLEVDPIGLVRHRRGPAGEGHALEQYVNDRPYVASSFLSVAIARVFGSALGGRCKERAELVHQPLPLTAQIAALPCRGGEPFLRKLFEPLGYEVVAKPHVLDDSFPEWGPSRYFTVTLIQKVPLQVLLTHLYVLIPVLDDDKHYWVGDDEVEKLLRHGEHWLAIHPEKEQIVKRYLKRQSFLTRSALDRLRDEDEVEPVAVEQAAAVEEATVEETISLNEQRLGAVLAVLKSSNARRAMDLGCGEGKLLQMLLAERQFEQILGVDVSHRMIEFAAERLHLPRLPPSQRRRLTLLQGSLTYRDTRLEGFDAAAIVEVIEHLDPPRLSAFERVVFEFARPTTVVLSTPNAEYNTKWATLPAGRFRHRDHRFEWTRAQFQAWALSVGERFGYSAEFLPVGPVDADLGPPTQIATFVRS